MHIICKIVRLTKGNYKLFLLTILKKKTSCAKIVTIQPRNIHLMQKQ